MLTSLDRNYSLLLAETDPARAAATETALNSHGHSVSRCSDGETAWQKLASEPFDLAIIDLDLAGTGGLELLGRMGRNDLLDRVPAIVIGDAANDELCDLAFGMGATLYVPKPAMISLLTHTVWCVLNSRARELEMRWLKNRLGISTERTLELAC